MQGCNRIFNCFRHCIHIALLSNVFTTSNSIDSVVYTREIFVVTLVQFICLGNSLIDLVIVRILVLQSSNRIFNSLCHLVYFRLLGNVFTTNNSIDSGIHSGEVLVVILIQSIRLRNGCIDLVIVRILVLQGCNRIFNCLCHCIHFGLLGNVLTTDNSVDSGVYTGEILVVILVQGIRLGNGFINLCIISPLVLQGCNRIFDRFRHCIYFALLVNVLTTDNSVDSGFHSGEILVLILVQGIRLSNCCINLSVVGRLDALQGKGSSSILSTIIFVCNAILVTIHCQRVSTYCPTAPIACLGNVEVSRQGGKVKCAVIANNDLVDIIITIQFIHICVADIQRGQLVLVAV